MRLEPGTRLGPYEVLAALGAGGMGEVWRARDTRLGRGVALKFLPDGFVDDPERHARFEREAKVLASLNHPHIATLYGLEHLDGQHALAMELVEGEGLDERIARGPIPMDEALPIALQIAEGLEAAHERGIVHRDLKPANVKVRPDGTVKVLDFGLAKAWEEQVEGSDLALSPTITGHHTRAGVILGTAAYMSPEQARGKPVDKRADIWAFGCVLYEMLTGARTFGGETVTDVIAAVVTREPDWSALPPAVPPRVHQALRRCLEKDPRRRFRDIGDVTFELTDAASRRGLENAVSAAPRAPAARPSRRMALPWAVAGAALIIAAGFAVAYLRSVSSAPSAVRSYILPPGKSSFVFNGATGGAVLSPDGSRLVFSATDEAGKRLLWVRPLDSLTAQPLEGTDGASYPFWSPDGRFVGFFASAKLKKIDVSGGPAQSLCDAPNGRGGTWSRAGVIVFAPDVFGALERVPSAGGTPVAVTKLDKTQAQASQRWPFFLPDGRHFLYWGGQPLSHSQKERGIWVASANGGEPRFLVPADSDALYAPPGFLLYLIDQSLMAQPFDAGRVKMTGEAFPIAEEVASPEDYRLGRFSVSENGTLVYLTGQHDRFQATWLNADGAQLGTLGEPATIVGSIRLSPNGQTLAEPVQDTQTKNTDIWLVDLARGVRTRFTFDPAEDQEPVWSPDGDRIVWASSAQGHFDLVMKSASGAGNVEVLVASDTTKYPDDWSRDGRFISFTQIDPKAKSGADLWILPMFGDRKPYAFLATRFNEGNGVFSPDGRWLAYESDESGRPEIYITAFPQGGAKWQVSQGGGTTPSWRPDGRALVYATPDGRLMEAGVDAKGGAVEVGTPHEFSKTHLPDFGSEVWFYTLAPKGDRILVLRPEETAPVPLTLVTHWAAGLKR
jgi:eukaryotic-like serine/threonine-protein kinase